MKALVVTVGGTPLPIHKTIENCRPDLVFGITSPQSRIEWRQIRDQLAAAVSGSAFEEITADDPNDLVSCFEACWEAFDRITRRPEGDKAEVVAGPTGGTKLMSAALLLAASEAGATVVYISGERDKGGVGVVKTGTERPMVSAHPYDLLARTAKQRLCEEFNNYRFESAMATCQEIAVRMPDRASGVFKALKKLCTGYRYWELFEHKNARHNLKSGLAHFDRLESTCHISLGRISEFLETVSGNIDHLERLESAGDGGLSAALMNDLLANARRRAHEGKYDDAVARLYRAFEMGAQVAFSETFNHSTSRFPLKRLDPETRQRLFPDRDEGARCDIGARDAYEVLAAVGHAAGIRYAEKRNKFRDLLNSRNRSILAHGTEPLDEKAFSRLYEYITQTFDLRPDVPMPRLEFAVLLPLGSHLESSTLHD